MPADPRPSATPALIGRLAVHLGMITMDQLAQATREQARLGEGAPLGHVLVRLGMVDRAQLSKLVEAQKQVLAKRRARDAAPPGRREAAEPVSSVRMESPAPPEPRPAPPVPSAASPPAPAQPRGLSSVRLSDAPPGDSDRRELESLLRDAVARGASDVHFHAGRGLRLRVGGRLADDEKPLEPARVERLVLSALTPEQRVTLDERGELDVCTALPGVGRFRANVYRQQRGTDGVFRVIPAEPPTLERLGLPRSLARFTNFHQGMVLFTGPAGCGKSSTMAALVSLLNEERREHILTVEDPIEYVHASRRCLVNQRSVQRHTESFGRALRAALREDPDVIVIGELRDLETISLALTAAETGHLVLATLHTNDAIRTINRLVGAFPSDQQAQVRTMLSESLRAVVSQRLLPRAAGEGRALALETLVVNKAVGNLIRENKTFQILSILQTGAAQGMVSLGHSLRKLVESGEVVREEALRHVEDPKVLGG